MNIMQYFPPELCSNFAVCVEIKSQINTNMYSSSHIVIPLDTQFFLGYKPDKLDIKIKAVPIS